MENWDRSISRFWEGAKDCALSQGMSRKCGTSGLVLLKGVLLYLQRAWAGSSVSASPGGRAAACDSAWPRSPDPGKPPRTLSTPHCQQHSADSWDGWRGASPPPAALQHTVRGGNNNTCSLQVRVQPLGISTSLPVNHPLSSSLETHLSWMLRTSPA